MGIFSKLFGDGGKSAGNFALEGARLAREGQERGLAYTQEKEAPLLDARNMGLQGLMDLYDPNNPEGQQAMIERAQNSPLYQQMIGNRQFGEDSIMRNQAATGGFRSGNTQYNLNDYNTRLSNDALLESYNQELGGIRNLAGTGTNTNEIANMMANIGQTAGQGVTAYGQARETGGANRSSNIMNAIGGIAGFFSDIRLKENTEYLGMKNGHRWHSWTWNKEAGELGLKGYSEGVMAHEVMDYMPEVIGEQDGYITVDMVKLGVI